MALHSLSDLLVTQLDALTSAEREALAFGPRVVAAVGNDWLRKVLYTQLGDTHEHLARLDDVFAQLDATPRGIPSPGMAGLIAEVDAMLHEEADAPLRDIGIVTGVRRLIQYRITSYETAVTLAEMLGKAEVVRILTSTLDEDRMADDTLGDLADYEVNPRAGTLAESRL